MGIYQEVADLLARLPAFDSPDERRALIAFAGPAELGIYLDWQGSNVAFVGRLLAELSRRGRAALTSFLAALPNTPQVQHSVERRQALTRIGTQLEALDETAFRAEFPVPGDAGAAARPIDPAMLAATLVNEVLAPYFKLGAEGLRGEAGEGALTLAEGMARQVEPALAGDVAANALWTVFRQTPEPVQAGLLGVLKAKLAADAALAARLAAAVSTASQEGEGAMSTLAETSRRLGLVSGDMVAAIAGRDVVNNIQKQSVQQQVGTVEEGGAAVGAVTTDSGTVTVGGQHYHGDRTETSGDVHFGNVRAGRDVIGRDQVVHGDQVGGNHVTAAGDIYVGGSPGAGRDEQAPPTFEAILLHIARRPPDPDVDREEIRETVDKLQREVAKGEAANPVKVERWLGQLDDLAPDVAGLTLGWMASAAAGAAAPIVAVARRRQSGTG